MSTPAPVGKPRLEGKTALIFGAGSLAPGWGIGKAMSVLFASHGARVAAVDVQLDAARETASIIQAQGGEAIPLAAEVSSAHQVKSAVDATMETWGSIDILVNNVGIGKIGGAVELDEEDWDRVAAVNLKGPFLSCKYVLPHMLRQGQGSILFTSSIASMRYVGYPHLAYATTKAGLTQMSKMIAMEHASRGIRSNTVIPGLIDTPRIAQTVANAIAPGDYEEARRKRDAQCPTGRMGDAWDVANAALYLASDEAAYVTGTEILVDGGLTARFQGG